MRLGGVRVEGGNRVKFDLTENGWLNISNVLSAQAFFVRYSVDLRGLMVPYGVLRTSDGILKKNDKEAKMTLKKTA